MENVKKAMTKMSDLSEDALNFMATIDAIDQANEDDVQALMVQIPDMKTKFEDHLDAVKLVLTKVKSYVQSL